MNNVAAWTSFIVAAGSRGDPGSRRAFPAKRFEAAIPQIGATVRGEVTLRNRGHVEPGDIVFRRRSVIRARYAEQACEACEA